MAFACCRSEVCFGVVRWFLCSWTLIRGAVKAADISQPAASHTFHHLLATRLLELGEASRIIQGLFRYRDIKTNMIYNDAMNREPMGVRNPSDIP